MGSSVLFSLIVALIFLGIFALSMHKDRSRYRNVVFLLFATGSVLFLIADLLGDFGGPFMMIFFILLMLLLLVLPIFLIINGVVMMRREGRGLANLLSLFLGIFLFAGEVALFLMGLNIFFSEELTMNAFSTAITATFPALIILLDTALYLSLTFLAFAFYSVFLQFIPVKRDFDYVIIHGAGIRKDGTVTKLLAERCDKAIAVYRRDPTPPYLIPSGGQGSDEVCSEAEAMQKYLMQNGIPEEKILMEDRSTTTMENVVNSRDIINSRPGRKYTALVTSNYHVYRAMRYARKAGLKAVGIGAHVAPYYWPSAVIREFIAVHREKKHLILFLIGYLLVLLPEILIRLME
jgi:uncharacterized SAM-binding protein YcdF (DUF218 family)